MPERSVEPRFSRATLQRLRSSGWTETRDVQSRIAPDAWLELPVAAQAVLAEFGYLLFTTRDECFAVCPYNDIPAIPHRVRLDVDSNDILLCRRVREAAASHIGHPLGIVGWDQAQELEAIAVDDAGRVYGLSWCESDQSGRFNVDLSSRGASFDRFLNYHLTPSDPVARKLLLDGNSESLSRSFTVQ